MSSKLRIFLTGGSGFLGSRIKDELIYCGCEVFAPRSREVNLKNFGEINAYLKKIKPDFVIHSAANYGGLGYAMDDKLGQLLDNLEFTVNLFKAIDAVDCISRVVTVGSACAYEESAFALDESYYWDGRPSVMPYGLTKRINFEASKCLTDVETCQPILTNLYGPGDVFQEKRAHVVAALVKKFVDAKLSNNSFVTLWGDGSPVREFLHVNDAAKGVVAATLSDYRGVINIGSGQGISIKNLAETISTLVRFEGELLFDKSKPNGVAHKVLNPYQAEKEINWKCKISLTKGLHETIDWYIANKKKADNRE